MLEKIKLFILKTFFYGCYSIDLSLKPYFVHQYEVSIFLFFFFGFGIFFVGLFGMLFNRSNFIMFLICLELSFLGLGFNFAILGFLTSNYICYVITLILLAVAAAEAAIALALLIVLYKVNRDIGTNTIRYLRD